MFCLYILSLARPAQAKIQMLKTSSGIVTILLKSLGRYWQLIEIQICFYDYVLITYIVPSAADSSEVLLKNSEEFFSIWRRSNIPSKVSHCEFATLTQCLV